MFPSVTGPKTDPTVPKWLDRLLNDCTRKLWLLENALAWQNRCKISSIRLSIHLPSISEVQNRTTEIQVTWTSDDIHLHGDSSTLLKSRLEYLMHLSFSWPTHKFYSCTFEHFLHRESVSHLSERRCRIEIPYTGLFASDHFPFPISENALQMTVSLL